MCLHAKLKVRFTLHKPSRATETTIYIKTQENGFSSLWGGLRWWKFLGLTSKKDLGIESGHPGHHKVWMLPH